MIDLASVVYQDLWLMSFGARVELMKYLICKIADKVPP